MLDEMKFFSSRDCEICGEERARVIKAFNTPVGVVRIDLCIPCSKLGDLIKREVFCKIGKAVCRTFYEIEKERNNENYNPRTN